MDGELNDNSQSPKVYSNMGGVSGSLSHTLPLTLDCFYVKGVAWHYCVQFFYYLKELY